MKKIITVMTKIFFIGIIIMFAVIFWVKDGFTCHYCDGNMDDIISVDYKNCEITYQRYNEQNQKTAKLNNVDENLAIENCKYIFTDLIFNHDKYRILNENGYDIEEINKKINIYVESLDYKILLFNDIINSEFDNNKTTNFKE